MPRRPTSCGSLAELLQAPVMTTFDGKSAFPEDHALALGPGGGTFTGHGRHFLHKSDLVLGDRLQLYPARHRHPGHCRPARRSSTRPTTRATCTRPSPPISGSSATPSSCSAQLIEAVRDRLNGKTRSNAVAQELAGKREEWLARWQGEAAFGRAPDQPLPGDLGVHARRRPGRGASSPTIPAARASSSTRSTGRPGRAAISAGASRTSSAPGWASRSAPRSPRPTSSASTSWATPRSA